MAIPSFEESLRDGKRIKPRIRVLEVKHRQHPDDRPIGWLVVEHEETCRRDPEHDAILEASLSLSYQQISATPSHRCGGQFHACYLRGRVTLTSSSMSNGAVFLDLPDLLGHRIGTYLMNEIVQWVRQWPEATVNSVELLDGQAQDDNRERRNRFYEQFGLVFEYTDMTHREGYSRQIPAGKLVTVETWKENIVEHRMFDYLADVTRTSDRNACDLALRDQACKDLIAERHKAETYPICWVVKLLFNRYKNMVLFGVFLIIIVVIAWVKMKH